MVAFLAALPISQPVLLALGTTLCVYLINSDKQTRA